MLASSPAEKARLDTASISTAATARYSRERKRPLHRLSVPKKTGTLTRRQPPHPSPLYRRRPIATFTQWPRVPHCFDARSDLTNRPREPSSERERSRPRNNLPIAELQPTAQRQQRPSAERTPAALGKLARIFSLAIRLFYGFLLRAKLHDRLCSDLLLAALPHGSSLYSDELSFPTYNNSP